MTECPHQILHPANLTNASGYANGILAECQSVWIDGQIGWHGQQVFEKKALHSQTRHAFKNIIDILSEAEGRPDHFVRLTWYVTDKSDYLANLKGVGEAYRAVMGKHFPAMTMVQVADLIEDEAKVEIEATAVIPA